MKLTVDDLRGALHEEAEGTTYPDLDALVAGAGRRVSAMRRRRLKVVGAATAAALVVGGLMAATGSTHRAVPQPAGPGPYTVNARGAGFPEYSRGMRRLIVLDAPMLARMKGSISVPTTAGRALNVQMTCTPSDSSQDQSLLNDLLTRMVANFTSPGGKGVGVCGFAGAQRSEAIGVATGATTIVAADVSIEPGPVALPKTAKIHVAIYESVPWQGYPFPRRPTGVDTPAWPTASLVGDLGPTTAATANEAITVGWPYDPKRVVTLDVRGPGRLRVLLNGNNISSFLGQSLPVRDGYVTYWDYNSSGISFPLNPEVASLVTGVAVPVTRPGAQVMLTIIPQDFTGPDWRVSYQPAAG